MHYSEIKYQPEQTRTYLGSPSVIRLEDGALVATHDYFGLCSPRNHESEEALTSIYRSEDNGQSWQNVTHVMNAYWSNLLVHRGVLYLFGVSQQYGSIVIRRSVDGGFTWSHPTTGRNGLLFRGGYYHDNPNYHTSPVPFLFHRNRIYRGMEECWNAQWGGGFQTFVISADQDSDLLDATSWTMSNKIQFEHDWLPEEWEDKGPGGWLEGNVCLDPEGQIWNVLRVHTTPRCDVGAMVRVSDDGKEISFDPRQGFFEMPGGNTKFVIRRDGRTGYYLSLVNAPLLKAPFLSGCRNVLSLAKSADLRHWEVVKEVLRDESGLVPQDSARLSGFQYVEWRFDGEEDIIFVTRMAWRGAHNFHDSNRVTFHRLRQFRNWL